MLNETLIGKQIIVTRSAHQSPELCRLLEESGARPLEFPCITIVPPEDYTFLDQALIELKNGLFNWLILTSVNSVQIMQQRLTELGIHTNELDDLHVAAIGPSTALAVEKDLHLKVDLIPDEYVAEALAAKLMPVPGKRILIPRAEMTRPVLVETLIRAGAIVKEVTAYRTQCGSGGIDFPAYLNNPKIDAITLTSSSTARFFVQRLHQYGIKPGDLNDICIACIGPITAETAREQNLSVKVVAATYTINGLVTALIDYFEIQGKN